MLCACAVPIRSFGFVTECAKRACGCGAMATAAGRVLLALYSLFYLLGGELGVIQLV